MRSPTLLLTLACTLVACGSDSGGPVDSGLPAERKGSELSDAEATQLCEAQARHFGAQVDIDDLHRQGCAIAGITAAALGGNMVSTCQAVFDACIDMEPKPSEGGGTCTLGFELSTCEATVTVIEDCLTEKNDALADAIKSISCNDVGKGESTPTTGPACTTAKASCPGIA